MQIDLRLTEPHLGGEAPEYLVALSELEPIVDDTGKVLLTDQRRAALGMLRAEERARSTSTTRGEVGPIVSIVLEAPARKAETIKRLHGVAKVRSTRYERCIWKSIKADGEKELQHPTLEGLHITPSLKLHKGKTVLTLTGVMAHGRVMQYQWGLIKGDEMLEWQSEGRSEDGTEWTKDYEGDQRAGVGLMLTVGRPGAVKALAFDFQDIALP